MNESREADPTSVPPSGETAGSSADGAGAAADPARVPVGDLVDLDTLAPGRKPTLRELRAALPRGWVLEPDGVTARRDLRLFFREGWILMLGLALFGAGGVLFFLEVLPSGWAGLGRVALYIVVIVIAAGWVAPAITRSLYRR